MSSQSQISATISEVTIHAFGDMGYPAAGGAFIGWLLHATRLTLPKLANYGTRRAMKKTREGGESIR